MNDDIPDIRVDGYKAFLRWYFKSRAPLFLFIVLGVITYRLVEWWWLSEG